jgi:LAS superfamily LD-carboxypeptidase LdcB
MNPSLIKTLTGRTRFHLTEDDHSSPLSVPIHHQALGDFIQLRDSAREFGFEIDVLSGFRSFEDQLHIWNRKVQGGRPVLDSNANPLEIDELTEKELVFAILRWSALPGASRHHWGTDLDIYDVNTKPEGYEIEFIPEEVDSGGMFGPLHDWLDQRMTDHTAFGFFRPYSRDLGGVSPERWHLSYAPVSEQYLETFSPEILQQTISQSDILLKEVILSNLDEIYERFVINITPQEKPDETQSTS